MKELFNALSNVSAFFTGKRFIYRDSDAAKAEAPAAAPVATSEAAPAQPAATPPPAPEATAAVQQAGARAIQAGALSVPPIATATTTVEQPAEPAAAAAAQPEATESDPDEYRKSLLTEKASSYLKFNSKLSHGEYEVDFKGDGNAQNETTLGDLLRPEAKVVFIYGGENGVDGDIAVRRGDKYFSSHTGKRIRIVSGCSIKILQKDQMDNIFASINSKRLARKKQTARENVVNSLTSTAAKEAFRMAYENEAVATTIKEIATALDIEGTAQWRETATWDTIAKLIFTNPDETEDTKLNLKDSSIFNTGLNAEMQERKEAAIAAEKKEAQKKGIPFQTIEEAAGYLIRDNRGQLIPIAGRVYVDLESDYNYATKIHPQ